MKFLITYVLAAILIYINQKSVFVLINIEPRNIMGLNQIEASLLIITTVVFSWVVLGGYGERNTESHHK